MEELHAIKDYYNLFSGSGKLLFILAIMAVAFYPMLIIVRRLINPALNKLVLFKNESYASILEKHGVKTYLIHMFICVYLFLWSEFLNKANLLSEFFIYYTDLFLSIYAIIFIAYFINGGIGLTVDIYQKKNKSNKVPISLHAHILKIIVSVCAFLVILSTILNLNVGTLLTSLGAAAALLTFVFKDMVLGLLASLQLTFQDIIKVGDWVTVPAYQADGTVELITITVVKIRNFDKTMSTVPTHALLTTAIANWRAMSESGGRRIKRSINLDIDTVKFSDQKILANLNSPLLKNLQSKSPELFIQENNVTNATIFRHYIRQYLLDHKRIHKQDFTFLVRQLQSTENGLPIEIYVFTTTTEWVEYENIQSEIFEHLFGVLPMFGLKAFQTVVK